MQGGSVAYRDLSELTALHSQLLSLTLCHSSLSLFVFLLIKLWLFPPCLFSPSLPPCMVFLTLSLMICHPPLTLFLSLDVVVSILSKLKNTDCEVLTLNIVVSV